MPFPELFRDDVFRIETARLWLRWPRAADGRALHRFASLAEVAEMTATWPHPLPEHEADRRILKARQRNSDGVALVLAIERKKEPGRMIGLPGLHTTGDGVLGLGFMLDPEFHNRGIMTEAVRAMLDTVLTFAPFASVRGSCRVDNAGSRRVFEKSGFILLGASLHDAQARSGPQQCLDFELSRTAWRSTSAGVRHPMRTVASEARAA